MIPSARQRVPVYCVWELTLACNARCSHCGSDAGRRREAELTTEEALDAIDQLADLRCRSITFSGGEPLLRPDWPILARAIRGRAMRVELITNGLLAADQAEAIAEAGFYGVNFSIDGTAEIHDELRGVPGAFEKLLEAARLLSASGVRLGAVTQINRRNVGILSQIREVLVSAGIQGWQLQLTMNHGRAALRGADLCLAPEDLPALEQVILGLKANDDFPVQVADNIGYMSRHEPALRSEPSRPGRFWTGCQAGFRVLGLTSHGKVRGCLSLPESLDQGASLRERSLADIWNDDTCFAYNRCFDPSQLEGPCRGCPFGRICRAGCTSLAVASTGSPFNNPYCLWRVSNPRGGA